MYREVENAGYRIGSRGTILSKTGKPMKGTPNSRGYLQVPMIIDGKRKMFLIHRLVASKWCKARAGCHLVNHKDGNKLNNVASNLEWVTPCENAQHAAGNTNYIGSTSLFSVDKRCYWREYKRKQRKSNTLDNNNC